MAFHDVRLPEDVERGAQGGPRFKTNVKSLDSGHEKRNIEWSAARGEWDISYGIQKETDLYRVVNFFYARMGRAHSFRFKDWTDYKLLNEYCGTGDGLLTQFQIMRNYVSGAAAYQRKVTKPVLGVGFMVMVDGLPLESGFAVDPTTGIITFETAPALGLDVTVTGTFDCHVRFDTDKLSISAESWESGSIPELTIVELKG